MYLDFKKIDYRYVDCSTHSIIFSLYVCYTCSLLGMPYTYYINCRILQGTDVSNIIDIVLESQPLIQWPSHTKNFHHPIQHNFNAVVIHWWFFSKFCMILRMKMFWSYCCNNSLSSKDSRYTYKESSRRSNKHNRSVPHEPFFTRGMILQQAAKWLPQDESEFSHGFQA